MKRVKEANSIDREDLEKVAEELNNLMFEEGKGISLKGSDEKLQSSIVDAAKELTPEDSLSDLATDVLTKLGCIEAEEKPVSKKKAAKAVEPEEEDEDEEEEEDEEETEEEEDEEETEEEEEEVEEKEEEIDLVSVIEKTRKLSELQAIVENHDEFKKLRKGIEAFVGLSGARELKAAMLKKVGKSEKKVEKTDVATKSEAVEKKVRKEKKEKKEVYPRMKSLAAVLHESAGTAVSKDHILKTADKLYSEKTGKKSNLRSTERFFNRVYAIFTHLGFMSKDEEGNFVVSKAVAAKKLQ